MSSRITSLAAFAAIATFAGCGGGGFTPEVAVKPAFIVGEISTIVYDGASDDLLTAGLGKTGLGGAAPTVAVPTAPTAAELRRLAIYNNYRAILDISPAGGYGMLYGPNIDVNGGVTLGEGKIAGNEYIAYADDGSGKQNVTLMVQVPTTFNRDRACIVTATSSGSRGVYGAIGTAGEWGLKHGCAVAYTDKGTGSRRPRPRHQHGQPAERHAHVAASAGIKSQFHGGVFRHRARCVQRREPEPHRVQARAFAAESRKGLGSRTRWTPITFAFYVLNDAVRGKTCGRRQRARRSGPTTRSSSRRRVSNGGGAAIAAAEQDTEGLIDGVAVGEP